jgi:hypothetical protein
LKNTFLERVDEYVALHRKLEAVLPREVVTPDAAALYAPRTALAAVLRRERSRARQGDIFSPAIGGYFRTLVTNATRDGGVADLLAIVEDENTVHVPAGVNGDYPAGRSVAMMPPCLLAALPVLPSELQYRFVGRDLILWDIHAGLIVDFAPHVIPEPAK